MNRTIEPYRLRHYFTHYNMSDKRQTMLPMAYFYLMTSILTFVLLHIIIQKLGTCLLEF